MRESTPKGRSKEIPQRPPGLTDEEARRQVAHTSLSQAVIQRARDNAGAMTPSDVLYLQRTVGNRAVNQMLAGAKAEQQIQPKREAETQDTVQDNAQDTVQDIAQDTVQDIAGQPSAPQPVHVTKSATPTIQRVVQSLVLPMVDGSTTTVYYSTYDSGRTFPDMDDAWEYDNQLAGGREGFDAQSRYPTNYSYYMESSRNVMPLSKQGPHTLAHAPLAFRLDKRLQEPGGVKKVWERQVLPKAEFARLLDKEKPSTFTPMQEMRMILDYDLLFDRAKELMDDDPDTYTTEKHELLMRLMQLHPYTAYGKGKMGKKALKGKGERKEKKFKSAFDKKARFKDPMEFGAFSNKRKELFSDAEESESEDEAPTK